MPDGSFTPNAAHGFPCQNRNERLVLQDSLRIINAWFVVVEAANASKRCRITRSVEGNLEGLELCVNFCATYEMG